MILFLFFLDGFAFLFSLFFRQLFYIITISSLAKINAAAPLAFAWATFLPVGKARLSPVELVNWFVLEQQKWNPLFFKTLEGLFLALFLTCPRSGKKRQQLEKIGFSSFRPFVDAEKSIHGKIMKKQDDFDVIRQVEFSRFKTPNYGLTALPPIFLFLG